MCVHIYNKARIIHQFYVWVSEYVSVCQRVSLAHFLRTHSWIETGFTCLEEGAYIEEEFSGWAMGQKESLSYQAQQLVCME